MKWFDPANRLARSVVLRSMFQAAFGRLPNFGEMLRLSDCRNPARYAAKLRSVIASFDRQTYPTPITVRFGVDDIETIHVDFLRLVIDKDDISVSRQIVVSRDYEPHVRKFVEKTLKKGMTAIDIGANVGFYSMLCSSIVGEKGKVFAFEPNSENCRLILLSLAANEFTNVTLYAFALSNVVGTVFFSPAIGSNGTLMENVQETIIHPNCTVVGCIRLDDVVKEPAHLLKVDVEGAEYLVLSGAQALIQRHRPIIIAELSFAMLERVSAITGAEFLRWMVSLSYRPFLLEQNSEEAVEIRDLEHFISTWGHRARIEDMVYLPRENMQD